MNLGGLSIVFGLLALVWATMPWGLILLAGMAWLATIDMRA
jgi:hypothetical protein